MKQKRQEAGSATGGQFAARGRDEASVRLGTAEGTLTPSHTEAAAMRDEVLDVRRRLGIEGPDLRRGIDLNDPEDRRSMAALHRASLRQEAEFSKIARLYGSPNVRERPSLWRRVLRRRSTARDSS